MVSLSEFVKAALERGISKEEVYEQLQKRGYKKEEIAVTFVSLKSAKTEVKGSDNVSIEEKLKLIFANPAKFFQRVRDKGIGISITLFALASSFVVALSLIVQFAFMGIIGFDMGMGSEAMIGFGIAKFIFGVVGVFAYAGFSHILLRSMKGEGNFSDTFNAIAYAGLPATIISIIPVVGWFSWIYAIILATFGFSQYHKVSKGRAVLSAIVPLAVLIIILIVFLIWLFMSLRIV